MTARWTQSGLDSLRAHSPVRTHRCTDDSGGKRSHRKITVTLPPTESQEQRALISWARANAHSIPALAYLVAIPNGAVLAGDARARAIQMRRLKAEGLAPGFPDLLLAYPACDRAGLFIEMKRRGVKPTPAQLEWHARLRTVGYAVIVCEGFEAARRVIVDYLGPL